MSAPVEVSNLKITRFEVAVPELMELFGIKELPLAVAHAEIEVRNVSVAVINGLRRTLIDEMPGYALSMPPGGFDTSLTSEVFTLQGFLANRLACLRLRPQISADVFTDLRLKLDVSNPGAIPLTIFSGDLEVEAGSMTVPLFNPTTELTTLMPGKRLVVGGIQISSGFGRDNGVYNNACCGAFTHLDIPQFSAAEMREEGSSAAALSGYKVSSLVARPRWHRLLIDFPATSDDYKNEVRNHLIDACKNIKERLLLIATAIDRRAEMPSSGFAHRGVQYTVVVLESGLSEGSLRVPNETHTIGEIIRSAIFELAPGISNIAYTIVSHENHLNLSARHTEDVTRIILDAIKYSIATFDAIQRGVAATR